MKKNFSLTSQENRCLETMAGLMAANQRGRIGGRPRAIGEKIFERASKMYESNELSLWEKYALPRN